jgi:hypothetical protein
MISGTWGRNLLPSKLLTQRQGSRYQMITEEKNVKITTAYTFLYDELNISLHNDDGEDTAFRPLIPGKRRRNLIFKILAKIPPTAPTTTYN